MRGLATRHASTRMRRLFTGTRTQIHWFERIKRYKTATLWSVCIPMADKDCTHPIWLVYHICRQSRLSQFAVTQQQHYTIQVGAWDDSFHSLGRGSVGVRGMILFTRLGGRGSVGVRGMIVFKRLDVRRLVGVRGMIAFNRLGGSVLVGVQVFKLL